MKSFKEFNVDLTEELTPDMFHESAEAAIKTFAPIVKKMFPETFDVKIQYSGHFGGRSSINLHINSPWKVTHHNAKLNLLMVMHLTDGSGNAVPMSKFEIEKVMGPRKVAYRKISGKTPHIAIKKYVDWLIKNRDGLMKVAEEG
jgi:hypothetical protein